MNIQEKHHKVIFLTNYALVLLAIKGNQNIRMRDISQSIGITERAVQRIVDELITEDYLVATKTGRRNSYQIDPKRALGIPFSNCLLSDLLQLCQEPSA